MIDANQEVLSVSVSRSRRRHRGISHVSPVKNVASPAKKPFTLERIFSDATTNPFDQVEWEQRTAEITDDAGKVIFKQENVEVPKSWSLLATKVVVSKYFYGEQGTAERETSVLQLIHRICR